MSNILELQNRMKETWRSNQILLETNGHFRDGEILRRSWVGQGGIPNWLRRIIDSSTTLCHSLEGLCDEPEWVCQLLSAMTTGMPLSAPIQLPMYFTDIECGNCGSLMNVFFDGKTLTLCGESQPGPSARGEVHVACPYPKGIPPFTMEINVPSGRLLITDDLRSYHSDEVNAKAEEFYINLDIEIMRCSQWWQQHGMLYGFVGNSCPGIYRKDNESDVLLIANPPYKDTNDEYLPDDDNRRELITDPITSDTLSRIGGICTDLWWYSIMDYDHANQLNPDRLHQDLNSSWSAPEVISVTPGRYQATHYLREHTPEGQKARIYARLVRIGECQ